MNKCLVCVVRFCLYWYLDNAHMAAKLMHKSRAAHVPVWIEDYSAGQLMSSFTAKYIA